MCDLSFSDMAEFMYLRAIQGPATVRAKEKCVVFHAFGCNITVMVTPLSSPRTTPIKVDGADVDSLNLIIMDGLPLDEPDVNPGWITGLDEEEKDEVVEAPPHEDRERWPATTNPKRASNRPILFTLVHGDVLVFYGDDFEVMNVNVYWQSCSLFLAVFSKASGNVFS